MRPPLPREEEQFQPAVMRRDVPLMRDELQLDEGQVGIVETLVTDYETQFTEASDKAAPPCKKRRREAAITW